MTDLNALRTRLLTTAELVGRGMSTQALTKSVATGELIRLRRGLYVDGDARKLHPEDRHLLSVLAADRALNSPVFSHASAALVLGLPSWGLPLRYVQVSGNGSARRSRTTRSTRHHTVPVSENEIRTVNNLRVTTPERTVTDIALTTGRDASIAVADAALVNSMVTASSLDSALSRAAGKSGVKKARAAMALVDPRCESVAETRSRLLFHDHGLPAPQTQKEIFDAQGRFVARVDFYWPEFGLIGECDGFGKYFEGADAAETRRRLAKEKDRDAALTALGYRVIHWRWSDLERPWLLAQRIRSVLFATAA